MLRSQPGPGPLLQAALDPLVVIGSLAGALSFFGAEFNGPCLILALLVFAMTFPGGVTGSGRRDSETGSGGLFGDRSGELLLDIVTGWVAIVGLLALLGWATRTIEAFDQRVLLAWALATPAVLFAAHRLLPIVVPRVLAVQGMRKVAVIAGANELGRKLAERLNNP